MNQNNIRVSFLQTAINRLKARPAHPGAWLNLPLAVIAAVVLSPVWVVNVLLALFRKDNVISNSLRIDALGREVKLSKFQHGYMKDSALFLNVLKGNLALVGASLNHTVDFQSQINFARQYKVQPGMTSLQDVRAKIGLEQVSSAEIMAKQLNGSTLTYLSILAKSFMNWMWFDDQKLSAPKTVPTFGLTLNNVSMKKAVDWAVMGSPLLNNLPYAGVKTETQVGFFINAHSVNTLAKDNKFKTCLQTADALFADGSGMRLAAKSAGYNLIANLNGTDMLPEICERAAQTGKSVYLLGGSQGIAEKAAENLKLAHPDLIVAGTHHGFFNFKDVDASEAMVNKINESGADIVLVGFGSPHQELWCQRFAETLQCQTLMAVGGLFDFYSGAIPRAPMFMREIGMEWVWRLIQEPKGKFTRYVVGTPEFLIRTFLLKQV